MRFAFDALGVFPAIASWQYWCEAYAEMTLEMSIGVVSLLAITEVFMVEQGTRDGKAKIPGSSVL